MKSTLSILVTYIKEKQYMDPVRLIDDVVIP